MGALQDKASRFAVPEPEPDTGQSTHSPVEVDDSDDPDADDGATPSSAEVQASVRRRMAEAVRKDLDLSDPKWIYYTLTEPLEPLGDKDSYAMLEKVRLPRKLYGRHYLKVRVNGELNKSGEPVTWWEIQMSRIASFGNLPMEVVGRMDHEDVSRLYIVIEEIIEGNFKTSAAGKST